MRPCIPDAKIVAACKSKFFSLAITALFFPRQILPEATPHCHCRNRCPLKQCGYPAPAASLEWTPHMRPPHARSYNLKSQNRSFPYKSSFKYCDGYAGFLRAGVSRLCSKYNTDIRCNGTHNGRSKSEVFMQKMEQVAGMEVPCGSPLDGSVPCAAASHPARFSAVYYLALADKLWINMNFISKFTDL